MKTMQGKGEESMRIIFVRHGEPNYEKDCLTETGRKQAAAAAQRLAQEGISEIYASPMRRAAETAAYTAGKLGLPVHTLDYMHELSWGGEGLPQEGHPWTLGDWLMDRDNFDFYREDWRQHPYFKNNLALNYLNEISRKFDALLLGQGYRHEGIRYFCETDQEKTIAVFSHGGSGACALAHLLALPFPYVCSVMPYGLTSVTILAFPVQKGAYVHPRIELFNDLAHTLSNAGDLVFKR